MRTKQLGLLLGPLLFLSSFLISEPLISPIGDHVIAVAIWMITWWVTEAVSISVTALLPLLLFPLLKIMPIDEVGGYYGSPIIFLFFGGFVLALALEKVNLHRRIALTIIKYTGATPNKGHLRLYDRYRFFEYVDFQYSHYCCDATYCYVSHQPVDQR